MSLASGDLTTLPTAKSYLVSAPSDLVLSGMITRISRMVMSCLNRPSLLPRNYSEKYNGSNTDQLVLFNWPLLTDPVLSVHGKNIVSAQQPIPTSLINAPVQFSEPWGFRYVPWSGVPPGNPAVVELVGGWRYWFGNQTTVVSYRAGYMVSNELAVIPASPFQVVPLMPYGQWATDEGVVFVSTNVPLTPVPPNTVTLASGQYIPPNPNTSQNYYAFSVADSGKSVYLSYGFIPADIEQAVLETIADRAAYRLRPGVRSQSLAGQETITYGTDTGVGTAYGSGYIGGVSAFVYQTLEPYVCVLPPPIGGDI